MDEVERFVLGCIKYGSMENAIHAALSLHDAGARDCSVLLGYLLMKSGEYRRSLSYLLGRDCFTSNYYKALCYQELKEYENAKLALERILAARDTLEDAAGGRKTELEQIYLLDHDMSFVLERLGQVCLLNGEYEQSTRHFMGGIAQNPFQYSSHRFVLEEGRSESAKVLKEKEDENTNNVFAQKMAEKMAVEGLGHGIEKIDKLIEEGIAKIEERRQCERGAPGKKVKAAKVDQKEREKELPEVVLMKTLLAATKARALIDLGNFDFLGIPSLSSLPMSVISDTAVYMFESGFVSRASHLFEYIRTRDKYFMSSMHYYSSILWHMREKRVLGILCRDLLGIDPRSHITWASLGNYFSLRMEHDKSITCFERSLSIKRDHYVLCLLGHELIINSDLTDGLRCFLESLKLKANNYSALAGCGLIYEKIGKWDNAEYCFLKAVRCNPSNVLLGYLTIQFLTSQGKTDKAYLLLKGHLCVDLPIEDLGRYIASTDSWYEAVKARALRNEQIRAMLSSFLLELALLYAMAEEPEAAGRILRRVEGEGPMFNSKKAKVSALIAHHAKP